MGSDISPRVKREQSVGLRGLAPVGCLDQAFLADRNDDGMIGRVHGTPNLRWESARPERAEALPLPSEDARMTTQEFVVQRVSNG